MNGLLLPGQEAAARQQQMALSVVRLQTAATILAGLLPQQIDLAISQATSHRGAGTIDVNLAPTVDRATGMAIAATDVLLVKLGMMAPPDGDGGELHVG